MASLDYWAEAPMQRQQMALFAPTLDAMISSDDPVRLVDEVLAGLDWSAWEAEYHGQRGQPPIHPRILAGAILYGLCRGLRSTRKLQEACCYRLDFLWLVEGRQVDYTTFAKFRTRFGSQLKDTFRQIGRLAMSLGLVRLGEVAFDGTRVKANNSRYNTRTAKTLAEKLAALDAQFDQMLAEWDAVEQQRQLDERDDSPTQLPRPLADLDERRQKILAALEKARALDEARRKDGVNPAKNPAQIPMNDPESRVMPNKEGGYAPNYTPTATTDGHCGFIVDCEVLGQVNETSQAVPSVDRIEAAFGQKPERFLTDSGNISGLVQQAMEERGIEFFAPVESPDPQPGNPVLRSDLTQAVPESEQARLPRNPQGQLDKSCFVYVAAEDRYYCPQGQVLEFEEHKPDRQQGQVVQHRVYRCSACAGCPLHALCVSTQNKRGRTITRDQFTETRQRTAQRMRTPRAKLIYDQRPRIAETPFGILKAVFGMRQFLLCGLDKVRTEWRWAATAFNTMKLVRNLGRLRAQFAELAAEPAA
ncbi:MAG: IS1182 family transposase [Burkholderiaceae bacterium]